MKRGISRFTRPVWVFIGDEAIRRDLFLLALALVVLAALGGHVGA